jgi:peptidoglycan/xylan/chitin deacetylase (PgdA/CDA1 family)
MMYNSINPLRWYLKKLARKGMAIASLVSGRIDSGDTQSEAAQVRVLTYHRFGNASRDPFCVGLDDFEAQMAWLARHNLAVSLRDIESFLVGEKVFPKGAVLVTVDDGFQSLYYGALPILKKYAIPAVAFITASNIGTESGCTSNRTDEYAEAHLMWSEVEALAQAGINIASHSWTHRSLGKMSLGDAREEAVRSREFLEKKLKINVTAFAYPFGTLADFNRSTATILEESGYKFAFTSQHGSIRQKFDPLALPRIKVEGGEALWMFRLLVCGGLDDWKLIDRTLWRLQQSPASGT